MRDPCLIVSVAIVFPGRASTAIESVWSFADVRDVLRVRLNAMRGQCFLLGQPEGVAARLQPRDVRWTWNVQVQLEVPASLAHRQDLVFWTDGQLRSWVSGIDPTHDLSSRIFGSHCSPGSCMFCAAETCPC